MQIPRSIITAVVAVGVWIPALNGQDATMERKIDSLLRTISLEQKLGQMAQITLDVIGEGEDIYSSDMPFRFDRVMLDSVIVHYKVGSILNTASNTPLEVNQWREIVTGIQDVALANGGIPVLYGVDQVHGVTYTVGGTLYPQQIGLAATFDADLVRELAAVTASESRATGVPWNFAPVLDMGRDQRWSRQWETFGEDTYLVSVLGRAAVEGYQGPDRERIPYDKVAACLKHYMGYGSSFSGKDRTPAYIPLNDLKERHFEPFAEAVRAGALSVMVNSGMINGVPVHADHQLLTVWLKEGLEWDGMIVTDWADINNLYTRDKVCSSKKEAVKIAINAGIDMAMIPYELSFCTYLKELVEEGEVPMERIDDAVRRILRLKYRLGLFDDPYPGHQTLEDFASAPHEELARQAALESITLLKNSNGLLPLDKDTKVLVAGPNANSMKNLNGGWTLSWQGEKTPLYTSAYNTILEAVRMIAGDSNVRYEPGITYKEGDPPTTAIAYWKENEPEIDKAVAAAQWADCIVLCLGENSYCETPGNLDDLTLSPGQIELARALGATGKPIILVLNEGRPRIIHSIEPFADAVLQTYLPGNYGGDAVARVLYGDANPCGKLPYTYPRYVNSLITYDHKPSENLDKMHGAYDYDATVSVQWPFGYGLSYTTFEYSDLTVYPEVFSPDDEITVEVTVTNTGELAGKETVMVFSTDLVASITPDVSRLRSFRKIELSPGDKERLTFTIPARCLAFVGRDGNWIVEEGDFIISCGGDTRKIYCNGTKVF